MNCVFCLDDLFDGRKMTTVKCGHCFHLDCYDDAITK